MRETEDLSLGQIVSSKAGRDKSKLSIIVEILDSKYVSIVDGELRKIDNPKKKKVKHLQIYKTVSYKIKEKLEKSYKIDNIDIIREINNAV